MPAVAALLLPGVASGPGAAECVREGIVRSLGDTRRGVRSKALAAGSILLPLLLFLSVSYFAFGTYRNLHYKIESDGKYYYQYLVSGFYDRDFDFANNYLTPAYPWMGTEIDHYRLRDQVNSATGRPSNPFTVGPALMWLPLFLVALGAEKALNALGAGIDPNPWGKYFQYFVMYSAVIYAVLALYLLYRMLKVYFSDGSAKWTVWLLLVATNLFYYSVFEVSMSHVYDFAAYVAYLYLFLRAVRSRKVIDYVGLGLVGGLCVLVRTQNVVTVALFSTLLLGTLAVRRERSSILLGAGYFVTLAVSMLPVAFMNQYLYGAPFAVPQGAGFLSPTKPHMVEVLFSLRNGLFSHHPVLLVGAVGFLGFLVYLYRTGKRQELVFFSVMLIAFGLQVYVNSIVSDWWAGDSFGQRRLVSSLPLFAFGLAYVIQWGRSAYPKGCAIALWVVSALGLYLTAIHVWLWSYGEPHNIVLWMFYSAPTMILRRFIR
jgi:hypothetical protein